ncbi:MAG: MATE family efflux transporter [Faecalibacterium sp.]
MTKDMTKGSPIRLIISFAIPLMLGSLFQQFYSMADTIIVGKFVGVEALAAVGSTGSLNYLILGCAVGICCGFAIPVAQSFGAHDMTELRRFFANSIWLSVIFAVVVTTISVLLTRNILVMMNTPDNIIALSDAYIRTIFAGIPATLLYNIVSAMMRALGDSKHPLYFLIFASFLNIGLDIFFILGLNLGVFGAALATVISQGVAGGISFWYMMKHFPELHCNREERKFSVVHCKRLCYIGIPMGLQCSITAIGGVVLQSAVNGLGSTVVAAQTAGSKASMMFTTPIESIGTTIATYCSQNLGAHRIDRIKKGVWQGFLFAVACSVVAWMGIHFFDRVLVELFVDAAETEIIEKACEILFWGSSFYIILAILIVYRYAIQGLGFSGFAMLAGVAEMIARAGMAQFCSGEHGFLIACLANPMAWLAATIFLVPAYFGVMRRISNTVPQAKDILLSL